jgi:HD-GYP domain-containing protein (c-di-GMP phosphodiesterase class II)
MRLTNIHSVTTGMKLGEPIFGPAGQVLLQRGVCLSGKYITSLREMGFPAVYIDDGETSDIAVPHAIAPETRARVLRNLAEAFDSVSNATDSFRASSRHTAMEHLQSERFAKAVATVARDGGFDRLFDDVNGMLDQLLVHDVLVGMNSIKTHDKYTFQHSIDVTVMGLMLAKKVGWGRARLKEFAIGCILHDIGKIFIDPLILNKPGPLTEEEFRLMKQHPQVGHDLIRAIAPASGFLVPQVALQHHEREDGSGYPRKLHGDGSLGAHQNGGVHEFGALSAVADVYDALTSDRPYRAGWTPERAVQLITSMSGVHFNRQAVRAFVEVVAPFPLCSDVRILRGRYSGHVGVVAEIREDALDRPKVRLLFNPFGKRIDPVEIDLSMEPDVTIVALTVGESTALAKTDSNPPQRLSA